MNQNNQENDPGFDGTLRDYLNYAEKMNIISNVDRWVGTRELRNIQPHDRRFVPNWILKMTRFCDQFDLR